MNVYIIQVSLLNGISEINQLFDDILIIWPAPVYIYIYIYIYIYNFFFLLLLLNKTHRLQYKQFIKNQ